MSRLQQAIDNLISPHILSYVIREGLEGYTLIWPEDAPISPPSKAAIDAELANIPNPPTPNWGAFWVSFYGSAEYQKLKTSTDTTERSLLIERFGSLNSGMARWMGSTDFLISYWNATIAALPTPYSAAEISNINNWAIVADLPVTLNASGEMSV